MTIDIDVLDTQHSELDDVFRRHAFESLRESGAVAAADVVATSPSGVESSQQTLDVLIERGMAIVEEDNLVAIDGLSVQPTKHRMKLSDDELFTWCAADAIGIPAALGEDGEIVAACAYCSARIVVSGPVMPGLYAQNARDRLREWCPGGEYQSDDLDQGYCRLPCERHRARSPRAPGRQRGALQQGHHRR